MNKALRLIFLFVFLIAIQVLVLNKILLGGFVNPYLYIAFVFLYPLKKNRFPILFLSFILGLSIDFFSDSGGIHAFATLLIAYLRLFFVKVFFRKTEVDFPFFRLRLEPFGKVFNYVLILTLLHHFTLFLLANFSFDNILIVLKNTLFSTVFTCFLFFLGNYIFSPKQN